jgi:hypothetical protein
MRDPPGVVPGRAIWDHPTRVSVRPEVSQYGPRAGHSVRQSSYQREPEVSEMHTPWGGGQPIPNTPFRRVIPADATDNRMVMLAVDMPPGENVAPHAHTHEDQAIIVVSGDRRSNAC